MSEIQKIDKIKIQPMQQDISTEWKLLTRSQIWYSNRPLQSKKQTINNYLDDTYFYWSSNILSDDFWYIQINTEYIEVLWKSKFNVVDWNKVKSIWNWTYMIQWFVSILPVWTDPAIFWITIEKTTDLVSNSPIFKNNVYLIWWETTIPFSVVSNFSWWDYFRIYWYNWDSNTNLFSISFDIIKLS